MAKKSKTRCHCATLPHRADCPVIQAHVMAGDAIELLCEHPPSHVTADVLEGDGGEMGVRWCRQCGAYQRTFSGGRCSDWRESSLLREISKELQR